MKKLTAREVRQKITHLYISLDRTSSAIEQIQESIDDCDDDQLSINLVVTGPSGAGKSTICKRILRQNPDYWETNENGEQIRRRPVIYASLPKNAKPRDTVARIAKALGVHGHRTDTEKVLTHDIFDAIERQKVKMLMVDESQHMLASKDNIRHFFKDLINHRPISLVFLGIDGSEAVVMDDDQLSSRFSSHIRVERFHLTTLQDLKEFRSLLKTIDKHSGLDFSGLDSPSTLPRLFVASQGILRTLIRIIAYAAKYAVEAGEPMIGNLHLERAYVRVGSLSSKEDWNPFSVSDAQLAKSDIIRRSILTK